jgi:hypothetical protein
MNASPPHEPMVILRPTRKLHGQLPPSDVVHVHSDTALGDWYVNRLVVNRQPLLLLVSSTSLLPILVPARDVRTLPSRLADLVRGRLQRCAVETSVIDAEVRAMDSVIVAPTVDRSVLGIMVDFAKAIRYYAEHDRWAHTPLVDIEEHLGETPCHAARAFERVIFPNQTAPSMLREKWLTRVH